MSFLEQIEKSVPWPIHTTQKMKFSIKDFFSKCDQIRANLVIFCGNS